MGHPACLQLTCHPQIFSITQSKHEQQADVPTCSSNILQTSREILKNSTKPEQMLYRNSRKCAGEQADSKQEKKIKEPLTKLTGMKQLDVTYR